MKALFSLLFLLSVCAAAQGAEENAVDALLQSYRAAGAAEFNAQAGRALWNQSNVIKGETRSCTSCHGQDLTLPGRHARSGKPIQALAPSVNPARLRQGKKISKWLTRNCKWTLGRECSAQEKGDLLSFLHTQ